MDGEDIVVQLVSKLDSGEYMAFGLSKNDSRSRMSKSDAVVAWVDGRGAGHAQDYYLDSKEQCVGERGSCPDNKLPDGRDGVTLLNTAAVNGYTMITFKRPQVGMDEKYDQHVYSDGPQAVVWAIGPVDKKGKISYHGIMRSEGNVFVDFARSPQWNCPQPADEFDTPPTPTAETRATQWTVPPILCPADRTLRAQVGPSVEREQQNEGVTWYLNGFPRPEVTLQRGRNYTFIVEGGNEPFYITDDPEGGFEHKSAAEKKKVKLFAVVTEQGRKKYTPTGKGRLCAWKLASGAKSEEFDSFESLRSSLELKCERGRSARITFRPDARTPDLVYYQSYSQSHRGGKIHVVDACDQHQLLPAASVQREAPNHLLPPPPPHPEESDFKRGGEKPKRRYFLTTTTTPAPPKVVTMETFQLRDVVYPGGRGSSRDPWWRPSEPHRAAEDRQKAAMTTLRHQVAALQQARGPPAGVPAKGPAQRVQERRPPQERVHNPPRRGVLEPQRVQPRPISQPSHQREQQQLVPVLVRHHKEPVSRSTGGRVVPLVVKGGDGGGSYSLQQVLSLLSDPQNLKVLRLN